MKSSLFPAIAALALPLLCLVPSGCHQAEGHSEEHHEEARKIVVTSPIRKDITSTQEYVCQIHSRQHIEVRALKEGYLERINIREGQAVKQGDLMFKILPTLYEATYKAEKAEADVARMKASYTAQLVQRKVVSENELNLVKAELAKANATAAKAKAELNFTDVKAPFDGIIDRQYMQQGSLVEEGDILTTLSDNEVMWVYFNVPEARYLEYMAELQQSKQASTQNPEDNIAEAAEEVEAEAAQEDGQADESSSDDVDDADDDVDDAEVAGDDIDKAAAEESNAQAQPNTQAVPEEPADAAASNSQNANNYTVPGLEIELELANGNVFPRPGVIGAIEGQFNNQTGNIAFRADFQNPNGVLRHGQTGNILVHRPVKDALIIPQRATFEILDKQFVFVVGDDNIVHPKEITIKDAMEDLYIIKDGIDVNDKIVFEGIRQVRDGDEVEYEFRDAQEILENLKYKAE